MKKRMLAIMMSALVAAGICSGVTVYADADSKTLTVGFDAEYPPFGYMDESGEYVGFDGMWHRRYVIILDGSL